LEIRIAFFSFNVFYYFQIIPVRQIRPYLFRTLFSPPSGFSFISLIQARSQIAGILKVKSSSADQFHALLLAMSSSFFLRPGALYSACCTANAGPPSQITLTAFATIFQFERFLVISLPTGSLFLFLTPFSGNLPRFPRNSGNSSQVFFFSNFSL